MTIVVEHKNMIRREFSHSPSSYPIKLGWREAVKPVCT